MKKIVTARGKVFALKWCGKSTIDSALRFGIENSDMTRVLTVFTNNAETETLVYTFDELATTYYGYTQFKGVDLQQDGIIVVALMEEQT